MTKVETEYLIPEDGKDTDHAPEKTEPVTRETATELNTELLQSINKKLDALLATQSIETEE